MTTRPRWGGRKVARLRARLIATTPQVFTAHVCLMPTRAIDVRVPATHPAGPSVGHLDARHHGGTDTLTNLGLQHLRCNTSQQDKTAPARRARVAPGFFGPDPPEAPRPPSRSLPNPPKNARKRLGGNEKGAEPTDPDR